MLKFLHFPWQHHLNGLLLRIPVWSISKQVFIKLKRLGYTGAVSIDREASGAQQIEDGRQEKIFLEHVLHQVMA